MQKTGSPNDQQDYDPAEGAITWRASSRASRRRLSAQGVWLPLVSHAGAAPDWVKADDQSKTSIKYEVLLKKSSMA